MNATITSCSKPPQTASFVAAGSENLPGSAIPAQVLPGTCDAHVLKRTDKFPAILEELAETGRVDKKPALIKLGSQQHYLELSFALQIAFPGAQSIWHIVDSRVGQMKLIRAMRLTKWFIPLIA